MNNIDAINNTIQRILDNYSNEGLLCVKCGRHMPGSNDIITIIDEVRDIIFPGYFNKENISGDLSDYYVSAKIAHVYDRLKAQINAALIYQGGLDEAECEKRAEEISADFISGLPDIQNLLLKDVQAGFDGDPAAKSKEDIIFSYPGLYAIFVYRIAHVLYNAQVPFIPRIMTEHAHSRTGIDINSGAVIGEYFFIDHGTGIVIGETCIIGNHVKLYQGVTLGALSTRKGQQLSGVKRHPTIEDNVTIYSGSTILGGETIIGARSIIGGNCFITGSVPPDTKVSLKEPELIFKGSQKPAEDNWEI
ncbi:MAG: serine acetyltransferase [Clostridia bacterium]|nr:serine acetyltransferase [Clostridia bacterium]